MSNSTTFVWDKKRVQHLHEQSAWGRSEWKKCAPALSVAKPPPIAEVSIYGSGRRQPERPEKRPEQGQS